MRVYLCVNLSRGQTMWRTSWKEDLILNVYTQKKIALHEYKTQHRDYIRRALAKKSKYYVMLFCFDIEDRYLTYVSGDELSPFTTEYELTINTVFKLSIKKLHVRHIIGAETWQFFLNDTRLRYKKTMALR